MRNVLFLGVWIFLCSSSECFARKLWESTSDSGNSIAIASAFKGTFLQSTSSLQPSDSGTSSIAFGRFRAEPVVRLGRFVLDAAYDNQWTADNNRISILNVLPNTSPEVLRVRQVGGNIFRNRYGLDYNELDRFFVAYQNESSKVVAGRQTIGWGRGTIFSAVDVFSPFSPFQFDREWKRGIDAICAEQKVSEQGSVDLFYAGSRNGNDSSYGGRLRGAQDRFDYEILVAKRAQDKMWAITSSAPFLGSELHGEFALFHTPGDFPSKSFFQNSQLVPKAVLGVSNNFSIGNGITASVEYHYSGFGASSAAELNQWLLIPSYRNRLARGDTQIIGNQAIALSFSYIFNEKWQSSLQNLTSLMDSSGVLAPSFTWDFLENASLLATASIPYGAEPTGSQLNSQFGSSTKVFIVQFRVYD